MYIFALLFILYFFKTEKRKNQCIYTFGRIDSFRATTMFGIIVNEHIIRNRQQWSIDPGRSWQDYLNRISITVSFASEDFN